MKIMKFGGTSVGKPERMNQIKHLITEDEEPKIVVLSALSGTTNSLSEISKLLANGDKVGVGVRLIDGNELGTETEADDRDVDFLWHREVVLSFG